MFELERHSLNDKITEKDRIITNHGLDSALLNVSLVLKNMNLIHSLYINFLKEQLNNSAIQNTAMENEIADLKVKLFFS